MLAVVEDGASELGNDVVAIDVYAIGDVRPGVTEVLETRLDPCEETCTLALVRLVDGLIAVSEDTGGIALPEIVPDDSPLLALAVDKTLEPRLVGENVKGDVVPFVVTQP